MGLREAVTNVVRHSGASACRVRLDNLSIEVADDGCGPRHASTGSGLTDSANASRPREHG